jgi:hypothetical protein
VKLLSATFLAKLFVDTIGALDPFGGRVYLPSPSRFIATFVLWGLFGFAAAFGRSAATLAGRLSVVVLLAAMFIGPFGGKAVRWLDGVTRFFPAENGGSS